MSPGQCPGVGTCDFENGLCGWVQRSDDVFDWTRKRGSTPSANTGPTVDHTLQTTTGSCNFYCACKCTPCLNGRDLGFISRAE